MTWLFSKAFMEDFGSSPSLPVQAEEYSEDCSADGKPYAQLNVMPTQHKFLRNDKTIEPSNLSRFGLTCEVLTEDRGEGLLMSYLEAFHARTYHKQAKERESLDHDQGYGKKWSGSFAKYDRDSSSWKIAQLSMLEDLVSSLEIWPSSGLMRSGVCWELRTLVPATSVSELGFMPTPTATDHKGSTQYQVQRRQRLKNGFTFREWLAKYSEEKQTVYPNPGFVEKAMGFPPEWTELAPLEMPKFHEWLRKQFGSSLATPYSEDV